MNISDCIDKEKFNKEIRTGYSKTLFASTLEEVELLDSIAKLLYKTKSVRKVIKMIDSLENSEYCIKHEIDPNLDTIIFNNSNLSNKEILNNNLDRRLSREIINKWNEDTKLGFSPNDKSKHEQIPYSGC